MIPNKPRLRLWVKWLLDPSSKQARGQLRFEDAYCCLGGACEVYRTEAGKGEWAGMSRFRVDYDNDSDLVLPLAVSDWFGLESGDPMLKVDANHVASATALNDGKKWNFAQIAKAITETYELDPVAGP